MQPVRCRAVKFLNRHIALWYWAKAASSAASGRRARLWFLAAARLVPLKERTPRLRAREWRGAIGRRPFWFRDRSELDAVIEVFHDGAYAYPLDPLPRTIVDLGANIGQASMFFRQTYPNARIVAVEP